MAKTMTSTSPRRVGSGAQHPPPEIFRLTPLGDREGTPVEVQTSRAPLSAREQRVLDELAMLFSIQEERCLSEAAALEGRESSKLSKASLTSSQIAAAAADASFIYQHVDFQVLSRCVPGFVKSHLNRSCRYLPETFILRVNYWRRRRMIGDESSVKRAKKEKVVRVCAEQQGARSESSESSQKKGRPAARPKSEGGKQTVRSG